VPPSEIYAGSAADLGRVHYQFTDQGSDHVVVHALPWFEFLLLAQVPPPPPVAPTADPALKQVLARLQGSWKLEFFEENGRKWTPKKGRAESWCA
jgi:hypothetical protein